MQLNMNRIRIEIILAIAAFTLLVTLQACQEEELGGKPIDTETLIKQGRYLAARNGDTRSIVGEPEFPAGTPYRLLAFVKPYAADAPTDNTAATYPRFNKVAWEGDLDGLRYINMPSDPDKWLGFSAINAESGGTDNLVSLDFYGFTYGEAEDHTSRYIAIDGLPDETTPAQGSLETLKRTETVLSNGVLKDLLRGQLSNQNIATVGNNSSAVSQSIMPYTHCFSYLQFMTVQQVKKGTEDEPRFDEIYIDRIELTGTYSKGSVYLQDGKVELLKENKYNRALNLRNNTAPVATTQTEIGEMIVFPTDDSAMKNMDGYVVGLNITVKGTDQATIDKFLSNSGSTAKAAKGYDNYWYGTIKRDSITNSITNTALYLKQNTAYTLIISFQDDAVRIITLLPQVEEWLNGEGTTDFPWQGQPLGQPQMFDNIVWSDRNLGADHYNPKENFEYTVGYFYQSGRNIPYYPFDTEKYVGANLDLPTPADKYKYPLADTKSYNNTSHKFYPMVDKVLLNMCDNNGWTMTSSHTPQMIIPETKPTNAYFDFMKSDGQFNAGLKPDNEINWVDEQNQPISGSWVLPSSDDFLSIFPSTPFAGNITFRAGGNSATPLSWGGDWNNMNDTVKTLRVTVPYYTTDMKDMDDPPRVGNRSDKYKQAWRRLRDNNDAGTTKEKHYTNVRSKDSTGAVTEYNTPGNNIWNEPDGDPEDGYASVYVISRDGEDEMGLDKVVKDAIDDVGNTKYRIKSWGTIYGIKRIYTPQAYRMRWRVFCVVCESESGKDEDASAGLYVEICRYRCDPGIHLNEDNFKKDFDWNHPAARLYFPICGLGDWTGKYINFGTECQYATCDKIVNGKTSALHIKITGDNNYNAYMAIIKDIVSRDFGKQIRPIGGVNHNR